MGIETFKPLTEEEKELTKSRIKSDANLIDYGAGIRDDGSLDVAEHQKRDARIEMDGEKGRYLERGSVNGIDFSVGWDNDYKDYTVYFEQILLNNDHDVSDQIIRINEDKEMAKKVFDYVKQEAQQESDVYKLYKKTENFIRTLGVWESIDY